MERSEIEKITRISVDVDTIKKDIQSARDGILSLQKMIEEGYVRKSDLAYEIQIVKNEFTSQNKTLNDKIDGVDKSFKPFSSGIIDLIKNILWLIIAGIVSYFFIFKR